MNGSSTAKSSSTATIDSSAAKSSSWITTVNASETSLQDDEISDQFFMDELTFAVDEDDGLPVVTLGKRVPLISIIEESNMALHRLMRAVFCPTV